jgi:hypothetical protein
LGTITTTAKAHKHPENIFFYSLTAVLFLAAVLSAQEHSTAPFDSLGERLFELPDFITSQADDVYLRADNFTALALAGTASIVMNNNGADERLAEEEFEDHSKLSHGFDEFLYNLGSPATHFGAAGVWYVMSASRDDTENMEKSWTMVKALSMTGFMTAGLKFARGNDTPNGKDLAWPSGHTSSSFAVAACLDEMYGPEVGVPAYIAAGAVGWRMMQAGDHWGSDVVFGAVLGYVTGKTIAGGDKDMWKVGRFEAMPYFRPETDENGSQFGINLTTKF